MEILKVHNPSGRTEVMEALAPRATDLHDKTICTMWNGAFRGNDTFPYLQQLLRERFPDAHIVPYNELFPFDVKTIGEVVKQKRCDVVIGGNGA